MKVEQLLSRFDKVKKTANGWAARCPNHDDKNASLSISTGAEGRILLKCFAGCEPEHIMRAIGLDVGDLFQKERQSAPNETVYKIPIGPADVIEHVRIDTPKGKNFIWRRNGQSGLSGIRTADIPLYRPDNQPSQGRLCITEGEKSAIAACRLGLRAFGTVTGANGCPSAQVLKPLCEGQDVVLWADNDEPGRKHMSKIEATVKPFARSVVTITTGGLKDDAADFRGTRSDLEQLIAAAEQGASGYKTQLLHLAVPAALASLSKFSSGDTSDRIPTGITKLDKALRGGMMPGALYLIGAPSGHGKTTLLQEMAVHCAEERGPVLFISPEMSEVELAEREIIRRSGFSMETRGPWVRLEERQEAIDAHERAAIEFSRLELPVFVDADVDTDMAEVAKEARKIKGLRLVIVDYAQEVADRMSTMARHLAVGEVGKQAIALGKELNVPVVVASQVNVVKGERGGKEYTFRETKDLEHRAHASMILEVTRASQPNEKGYHPIESAHLIARKNRSGPLFNVQVEYRPEIYSITNHIEKPWVPPVCAASRY